MCNTVNHNFATVFKEKEKITSIFCCYSTGSSYEPVNEGYVKAFHSPSGLYIQYLHVTFTWGPTLQV